jgi:steroid 5-alpha reductase family enzyme
MSLDSGWQLIFALVFATCFMVVLWFVQFRTDDAGVVDVGWSASLGFLAIFYAVTQGNGSWRSCLVAGLASIWSFRLAIFLLRDRVLGKPEDGRYQKLRSGFGSWAQVFFFGFFQVQAILAWFFSLPFWIAIWRDNPLDVFDLIGVTIWLISFLGESTSDWQLARFRSDSSNRGKTCRRGLWRYSRHPNYFFEWLYWWSYVAMAWYVPLWWLTLLAPGLMLFFLFKVTGIPATEAHAVLSRGDDYRDYQRTTSVFIPWFPKKSSS